MKKKVSKKEINPANIQTRDQFTIVLENIWDSMKLLVEGFTTLADGQHRLENRIGNLHNKFGELRGEVSYIRHNITTREKLKLLEARVLKIEKTVFAKR